MDATLQELRERSWAHRERRPWAPMEAKEVARLAELFRAARIEVWLDGGWGVDALLGEQTREHDDLDLVIALEDAARVATVLEQAGYKHVAGQAPRSFVLVDPQGRQVDVHPVRFDEARGGGVYQMDDGHEWVYPSAGFAGRGRVARRAVRCLTPEVQMLVNDGYELTDRDYRELRLLHERFGGSLPAKHAAQALRGRRRSVMQGVPPREAASPVAAEPEAQSTAPRRRRLLLVGEKRRGLVGEKRRGRERIESPGNGGLARRRKRPLSRRREEPREARQRPRALAATRRGVVQALRDSRRDAQAFRDSTRSVARALAARAHSVSQSVGAPMRSVQAAGVPRRGVVVWLVTVLALSMVVLRLSGDAAAQEEETAVATRGDLVVSVSAVGRIVSARPTIQIYPRTAALLERLLVRRGQRIAAGQPLAVLDDGGAAAAATRQALSELQLARLQLQQLRASRPAEISAAQLEVTRARAELETLYGGNRAARSRAIAVAESAVRAAEVKLAQLYAPPTSAEIRAAQLEVTRAEAALALLLKAPATPLPEVVAAAEQAVVVAQKNLERARLLGTPAEVSAAQLDLYKAQAELASLLQPPQTPLAQEVAAARAAVESAKENLRKLYAPPAPADVQAARLELDRARADLRQLQAGPSATAKAPARQALRSAHAKLRQTASPIGLQLAQQNIVTSEAKVEIARAAERLLTVRALTSGTVETVSVAPGAFVDTTTPLLTLVSLDDLLVTVDLSEFDVAQVKLGQKAIVSVDALGGKTFPGRVVYIPPTGVDSNGVVTYPVQVGIRRNARIKPGMNVSVRIVAARQRNVVRVPLEAISQDEEDRPFVSVLDKKTATETARKVVLGLANNDSVQVVKGLRAGEVVLLPSIEAQGEDEEE